MNTQTETLTCKQEHHQENNEICLNKVTIRKEIIAIAWPSVAELVLVMLCQMVDMMMVGRLGPYAISSVGLTTQPRFLMLAAFIALNVGTTALVARYKGENKPDKANEVLRQSIILTLGISIVLSIVGIIFGRNMIVLMGGAPDTISPGTAYFSIIMMGFVFITIPLCISAALKGVGNTKASMKLNIIANVVNVIFNYLLIYGKFGFPALGVRGAAIATIIGAFVSVILAFAVLMKGDQYIFISLKDNFKPNFEVLKKIVRIGIPSTTEQLALRVGLLLYTRVVAGLGTEIYATHQITLNILGLSFMNGQAFGIAAASLVGQSLGKKRYDLAKLYAAESRFLGSIVSTVMALCFFIFGAQLVSLYTQEKELIRMGGQVLKIIALLQPFQSSLLVLSGALRGAGDTRWPAISTFVGIVVVRPILSFIFIFVFNLGLIGAWISLSLDNLVRFGMVYYRFKSDKWTTIKL